MTFAARKLGLQPTALQFAGFAVLCVAGLMIHYSLMFLLASVSFWTVRAQGIVRGYYTLFNIARMPDEAFRGAFKAVFTFALPVLLVSNVPVRVLADKLTSPVMWLVLVGLGVVWMAISEWFWRLSIAALHQREQLNAREDSEGRVARVPKSEIRNQVRDSWNSSLRLGRRLSLPRVKNKEGQGRRINERPPDRPAS